MNTRSQVACLRICLFACLVLAFQFRQAEAEEPWSPPWARSASKPSKHFEQTDRPFVFLGARVKFFPDEASAQEFADKQVRTMHVKPMDDRFQVYYMEEFDISSVIPENEREQWRGGRAQYALYTALLLRYDTQCRVEDGRFVQYPGATYMTEEAAQEGVSRHGEIFESHWETRPTGVKSLRVLHRKPIDLLAEARPILETINLAYEHLILEPVGPLSPLRPYPSGPLMTEGGMRAPGRWVGTSYVFKERTGGGDAAAYIADEDDGLDHDYLRNLILIAGAKVQQRGDGHVVVTGEREAAVLWKAGPRLYYCITGGQATEDLADAYLAKFPSVLPADYKVDAEAWMREEVRRTVALMRERAAQPEDKESRYMSAYFHFCRMVDPVPDAPLFASSRVQLDAPLRRAHFALVDAWWKGHKDDIPLRAGAPWDPMRVGRTIPQREPQWKPLLDALRRRADEAEKEDKR
jgi:hypothetical protein